MKANEMWQSFCQENKIENASYEAWSFGGTGDELAKLTLMGIKTATASPYRLYEIEGEAIPKAGDYSVVCYDNDEACCIIRNYDVLVVPINEVSKYHAYLEGEDDRSYEFWKSVHEKVFLDDFEEMNLSFEKDEKLVLEKYDVVYTNNGNVVLPELRLEEISARHKEQLKEMRSEYLEFESSMDGCGPLRRYENIDEYLEFTNRLANPSYDPRIEGLVSATQLCAVRRSDNRIVGMIQIRHYLKGNENLEKYGLNIGYSVRPSERRKGYAKWMLKNVLPYCKALEINPVGVSCTVENEGSRRTILANGGVYEYTIHDPDDNENLERYWIYGD